MGKSPVLISLFSREFQDTSDHEIPSPVEPADDGMTPADSISDDYPIHSFNANMDMTPIIVREDHRHNPNLEESADHSFNGYEVRSSELNHRYPPLTMRDPVCSGPRDLLLQCYQESSDVLDCSHVLQEYTKCAVGTPVCAPVV